MRGETPAVEHVRTRCCFSFSSCLTLCGPTRAAPRVDSFGDQTGLPSANGTPTARRHPRTFLSANCFSLGFWSVNRSLYLVYIYLFISYIYIYLALHIPYTFQEVRRDAAAWLRLNENFELQPGSKIKDFMDASSGDTWANFCDGVQHFDGARTMSIVQWGEQIHLIALANAYRRTIRVWTSWSADELWTETRPHNPDPGRPPFDIAHEYEMH